MNKYDIDKTPAIFGLRNNSSLCYFNSLIQSLMSCSSFNNYLLENQDKYINNQIVIEYIKLYEINKKNKSIVLSDAFPILEALYKLRKRNGSDYHLSLYSQEDIHEGLILLIDSISGVDKLFHNRYQSKIICLKCKHNITPNDEPPEIAIDITEDNTYYCDSLDSKEKIEKYIMTNVQIPRDYKCEKCGIINTYDKILKKCTSNIVQIYCLRRLSNIIVLMFKKYNGKKNRYFPEILEFQSIKGLLKYRLISQIEHYGSTYGGHYTALCMRKKPITFYENRIKKATIKIAEFNKLINNTIDLNKIIEYQKKIKLIQNIIENDKKIYSGQLNENLGVFLFNDQSVSFSKFEPTVNTYVLFYHLI